MSFNRRCDFARRAARFHRAADRQGELSTVGLGATLGVAGGLAVTRLMSSLFFGVGLVDPRTIAGALAALTLTAVVAAIAPSMRALRVEATASLRGDV